MIFCKSLSDQKYTELQFCKKFWCWIFTLRKSSHEIMTSECFLEPVAQVYIVDPLYIHNWASLDWKFGQFKNTR